ncbi:bifunctional demethylmenaquinone methyltransferase/2-methoxy-6-polyprenyl-1,4-benzoquinol methylase UbiE [Tuwongella immobilis]|uniref:Demethylmenaquinone methyltransferase n=1 Tax=Tuwongella immobilis TaxID=692036 RepID=A0A6C2YTL9_9BACT|nr:bifunctional demethylmenaquinone methyltransferase/2-methoxy-6-polyprenyl-1,4-benzoquinol methylase UbiE [Tuwongella immobilis]VIP04463.1 demethylmenaquinone methyltransferase : Demethylmenaquinone methyltransferase OS=Singulisphaera acidiphila (strain ATCC BAA-1392 / DSM 18658 / VKM B-2454 / MOB10) GN=menG PE=3 SV=1: Ubie_methyltran [Tuwongella immobilis]VTS06288.1 demethylmenaquinone methyltransferase : Demethylmenaquinone methyltransferase OS=Singulisphaera acidiphila (strain ATCC BAA-1392 
MSDQSLDKRNERIRSMFSAIAPKYDALNHILSLNIDQAWRKRTTKLVPPEGDAPILDACTGTGDLALMYHKVTQGKVPIVGTDFCYDMLARAVIKTRKRQADDRITYLEADTQALPFADNTFQITTVAFGLRNVADPHQGLAEMVRVTRPNGRVAVLEFSRPRVPLLGKLYRWYFKSVLPRLGQLVSKSPDQAYHYLPASVMQFPDGDEFLGWMRTAGLTDLQQIPLTLGIATLYIGRKLDTGTIPPHDRDESATSED